MAISTKGSFMSQSLPLAFTYFLNMPFDPLCEGTGDGEEGSCYPLRILGWDQSSQLGGWTRERRFLSSVEELDVGVVMAEIGSRLNNLLHTQ